MEAQAVGFLQEQRGRRARDAPARMPHASDDTVEVVGDEDGDPGEGLVHLDPQDVIACVGTTLRHRKFKKIRRKGKGKVSKSKA